MPELDYFIDCHHHMFTIADVPLYQTIHQTAHDKLKSPKKLVLPIILAFYLPLVNPEKKVEAYEKFIRFFENEPPESVDQVVNEVQNMLTSSADFTPLFTVTGNKILLTPLIMDMDLGGSGPNKKLNKLQGQIARLEAAIKANGKTAMVMPFIGIDPRREYENADHNVTTIKKLLGKITPLRTLQNEDVELGEVSFIGIKLYPSLGFNPNSNECKKLCNDAALAKIPITVHCQQGSLKLVNKADDLNHPKNWVPVLKYIVEQGSDPIINFAHFGGEDEVANTIGFQPADGFQVGPPWVYDGNSINEDSWTYLIIRMLKSYPHTYADISAFDYSNCAAVAALHWILYFEKQGRFGTETTIIADKLLWGSDYPMSLKEGNVTYSKIFKDFVDAIKSKSHSACPYPPKSYMDSFDADKFIRKVVCDNPKKFLGILES